MQHEHLDEWTWKIVKHLCLYIKCGFMSLCENCENKKAKLNHMQVKKPRIAVGEFAMYYDNQTWWWEKNNSKKQLANYGR